MMATMTSAPLRQPLPPEKLTELAKFTGGVTSDGRRFGFCSAARPLCVRPHRVSTGDTLITDTVVRCRHQTSSTAPQCGLRLYVAVVPFPGPERVWMVVEVTDALVRRLQEDPMTFLEKMSVLGFVLPGVDIDLAQAVDR
ncbi:MAG: hypothetical protein JWO05_1161 [Gemmatimonadetes bacterium]|nr:hypothetical protein [Gemmatimonadota bacterium]